MELEREFRDYDHLFNHLRIHGTFDYQSQSPVRYKQALLKEIV